MDFDDKLIKLVWARRGSFALALSATSTASVANSAPDSQFNEKAEATKEAVLPVLTSSKPAAKTGGWRSLWGWRISNKPTQVEPDLEKSAVSTRHMRLFGPFYGGLGCALSVCTSNPVSTMAQD